MGLILSGRDDHDQRIVILGQPPAQLGPVGELPRGEDDWKQANPKLIGRLLERALARPTGNWYVLDPTADIPSKPTCYVIDGHELVTWRTETGLHVAPNACPHMGASLAEGCLRKGKLVCPWHGLGLDEKGLGAWQMLETHDDGVLTWVRLGPAVPEAPKPILPPRPSRHLTGVVTMTLKCDPEDVVGNRFDPWHGAHLHSGSFARLRVVDHEHDLMRMRVAFRLFGPFCIEVDCTFHSPEPRTIVMTIIDGEGIGSVVETHAVPVRPGECRLIEVTLAASPRPGFRFALPLRRLMRPLIARSARQLWKDDAVYAERTYALRQRGTPALPARVTPALPARGTP